MAPRTHAFGERASSLIDTVIFYLRRRQICARLPELAGKRIADFGSGYDARLLMSLLQREPSASGVAVDINFSPVLKEERQLTCLTNNLNDPLTLPSESLDIALSLAVLEHLDRPQEFLAEVYRVLRPGGVFLLTTPGPRAQPVLEFMAFRLGIIDAAEIEDHRRYFSSSDLRTAFAAAGFSPEQVDARTFLLGMNNVVYARKPNPG